MLIVIAKRGDPFEVEAALLAGADPNECGPRGETPLMKAAKGDHFACVYVLVKHGANLQAFDPQGNNALHHAASVRMKKYLLKLGIDPRGNDQRGPSMAAFFAEFGESELVRLLLHYGVDPEERTPSGKTVAQSLDGPSLRSQMAAFDGPASEGTIAFVTRESSGRSPEEYAGAHPNILIWSFHAYDFPDPEMKSWAEEVSEIISSPERYRRCVETYYEGEEKARYLKQMENHIRKAADRERVQQRASEYEALHGLSFTDADLNPVS